MRKLLLLAPFLLAACSTTQTGDALTAVDAAFSVYADVYQPAVISYGGLPHCGATPTAVLCRDQGTFDRMKTLDAQVTASISAANTVIKAGSGDSGQITAAIQAISSAEQVIAASGIMVSK